jgi:hypothetical protein
MQAGKYTYFLNYSNDFTNNTVTCSSDCRGGFGLVTTRDYTLQVTITHRLAFSVTVVSALFGNVVQR